MILVKLQEKKESQSGERKGSRGGVTYICEKLGGQMQKTFLREIELFILSLFPLDGQKIQYKTKFRVIK